MTYIAKDEEGRAYEVTRTRENCESAVETILKRLNNAVEKIERDCADGNYEQIIHEVSWTVANLNLDMLARYSAAHAAARAVVKALDNNEEATS